MPVINGVYLKDFTALPGAVADADIIPIAITGNQIAYRTTVAGIITDARITAKLLTGLSVTGGAVVAADTILQAFGKVQNQINGKQGTITLTTTGTSGAATFVANTLNIPNYADGGVLSLSAIGGTANANGATITGTVLNLQPASSSFGGVVTTGTQTIAGEKTFTDNVTITGSSSKEFSVWSTGGNAQIYIDRASVTKGEIRLNTLGVNKWAFGFQETSNDFLIRNASTSSESFKISNTTNAITIIAGLTGTTANFTGQLTLGSTITNGTYTYTLPSATGTLALTSDLSSYLPLSGGTLTGALSGTSATFSGDLTIDTNTLYVDSTNNKVGIRNASPLNLFDVKGAIFTGSYATSAGARFHDNVYGINLGGIDASSIGVIQGSAFEVGAANIALQPNGGNVGIGTASPGYQLQLSTDSAAKPSTNTWTISSDSRLKENITPYTKGLSAIMAINPVNYDYNGKAGFSAIKNNIGVIAQDVLEILPESISTYKAKLEENDAEDTELYNFNSHALTYILINAIKELKAEIDLLKGIAPIEPEPIEEVEPIVEVAAQNEPESEPKAEPVEPEVEPEVEPTEEEPEDKTESDAESEPNNNLE